MKVGKKGWADFGTEEVLRTDYGVRDDVTDIKGVDVFPRSW